MLIVVVLLAFAGCSARTPVAPMPLPTGTTTGLPARYSKVLIIAEENHGYGEIIGSPDAPYINQLAATYGTATRMNAGYPAACPSLAAYILMTSGTTSAICDDRNPSDHELAGLNVFAQVAASGQQWREYAESATGACQTVNSDDGRFLVRHTPPVYYVSERSRCAQWDVPLGDQNHGALHDDLAAGTLPAYSFVTPDACDDMHGASACDPNLTAQGDNWLHTWVPQILAGPDYRAGRLVVIITWDEGTGRDNHIPMLVISPTTSHVSSAADYTHCSTLRTAEEILRVPLLGCAATATSMVTAFHL